LGVTVEANLFSRLVRVVKAYVSNYTEQWEDPEVLLDRVTDEMNEDLIKMRQATAKVRDTTGRGLLRCCLIGWPPMGAELCGYLATIVDIWPWGRAEMCAG
jgi:hypothetical protein